MTLPIGLQLYSIKEETEKDFKGTLKKVAEIGFQGVEFAGYGNLTSGELKATLDELSLKACGSHVPIEHIIDNLEEVIRYNKEIGNNYIICPYASFENKEEFIEMAKKLTVAADTCKAYGIKVGYHNHAHEFVEFNGEYGFDIILNQSSNDVIGEIDVYWAQYTGIDPVGYINKHSGRFELIHIKDLEEVNGEKRSTEIGNGLVDIPSVVKAAENQGAKWLIIEQEFFTKPCLESVKEGFNYLNKVVNE